MTNTFEAPSQPDCGKLFDISPATILAAAQATYGAGVRVSAPYWVDADTVRVGVSPDNGNTSFGANFNFKEGRFH